MKTLLSFLLLFISAPLLAVAASADSCNHQLYYTAPATIWEETLPLGNGRLGMMPDGGIRREHIVLNEISLWSGMEADYSNPDASRSLPAIRELLFQGKNLEAQELMYSSFVPKKQETDGRYGAYQTLGALDIDFSYQSQTPVAGSQPQNYRRWLSLRDAVAGYAGNYGNMGLYGVCDWNEFGTFYYVSGFAGYLVLAFYLVKFPPAWSWRKTLGICIPAFLIGYLITGLGYVMMQKEFPGNYAYLEIVWYFAGINVFLMTAPVFILVQKAAAKPRAWLSRLAGATFGIYLCHFIFVQAGYDLVQQIPGLPALVRIPLIACGAFAVSWLVVWLMQRWRLTRKFVE